MSARAGPGPGRGEVEAALDRTLATVAEERGGVAADPPPLVSRELLDRVGFFASFPDRAVAAEVPDAYVPPATCYRVFQELEGRALDGPVLFALAGTCARREPGYDDGRLPSFTMREAVTLAAEEGVVATRDGFALRSRDLARALGLDAHLEEAEDPFFAGPGPEAEAGRGKRLLQRMLRLKLELVVPGPGGPLAIASFNLHQDFFGTRLGITLGGAAAWSGCAAWGIERWRLALENRWGPPPWPRPVREAAGLAR